MNSKVLFVCLLLAPFTLGGLTKTYENCAIIASGNVDIMLHWTNLQTTIQIGIESSVIPGTVVGVSQSGLTSYGDGKGNFSDFWAFGVNANDNQCANGCVGDYYYNSAVSTTLINYDSVQDLMNTAVSSDTKVYAEFTRAINTTDASDFNDGFQGLLMVSWAISREAITYGNPFMPTVKGATMVNFKQSSCSSTTGKTSDSTSGKTTDTTGKPSESTSTTGKDDSSTSGRTSETTTTGKDDSSTSGRTSETSTGKPSETTSTTGKDDSTGKTSTSGRTSETSTGKPSETTSTTGKDDSTGKTSTSGRTTDDSTGKTSTSGRTSETTTTGKDDSTGRTTDDSTGKPSESTSGRTTDDSTGKTSTGKPSDTTGKTTQDSTGKTTENSGKTSTGDSGRVTSSGKTTGRVTTGRFGTIDVFLVNMGVKSSIEITRDIFGKAVEAASSISDDRLVITQFDEISTKARADYNYNTSFYFKDSESGPSSKDLAYTFTSLNGTSLGGNITVTSVNVQETTVDSTDDSINNAIVYAINAFVVAVAMFFC